jgi:hypothetical protein
MFDHYPIHELIENQRKRLGLRRSELARRCGFKNLDKGLRRISAGVESRNALSFQSYPYGRAPCSRGAPWLSALPCA